MRFWSGFFLFAAIWNFIVGGVMLAAAAQVAAQMGLTGPASCYMVAFGGILVATFGLGYAMVSRDPARNRGIVVIGMVGKVAVALLTTAHAMAGHVPMSTFYLGLGDVAFAAAFAVFLTRTPRPG